MRKEIGGKGETYMGGLEQAGGETKEREKGEMGGAMTRRRLPS
jgi:hypothetical protein